MAWPMTNKPAHGTRSIERSLWTGDRPTYRRRSRAMPAFHLLALAAIFAVGWRAGGGFVSAAAFAALTVAACMLASLFQDAKNLARESGAVK